MANAFDELHSMIRKVILDATRYYVPRIGQVSKIADELGKARLLVHIPSLGWDTDDTGAWCYPKDKNALVTPKIGDYVVVEFLDGDRNLPVYSGRANQMKDMLPDSYTNEKTQVLFEDPQDQFKVRYSEDDQELQIGEANESYVKGDTTKPELQKNIDALTQLQADFTAWTPVPNDGGLALKTILTAGFLTKTLASLTNMLSDTIKGE